MGFRTGKLTSVTLLMLMIEICYSSPISTTLYPADANPTPLTIQKSIETHSIEPKLERTGWEPIVMQLLPKDSYFPQTMATNPPPPPSTSTATTALTTTTTTEAQLPASSQASVQEESDKANAVDLDDGETSASLQSHAYTRVGSPATTSWQPISPFYESRNGQAAAPAYYPSPANFGSTVNNYKPPAVSYQEVSNPSNVYPSPKEEQTPTEESYSHYNSQYPSPVKAAAGIKYGPPPAEKSSDYQSIPVQEYGTPEVVYGTPESKKEQETPHYDTPVYKSAEYSPSQSPSTEYGLPEYRVPKAPILNYASLPSPTADYGKAPSSLYGSPSSEYGAPGPSHYSSSPQQNNEEYSKSPPQEYPSTDYGHGAPTKSASYEVIQKEQHHVVPEYGPPPPPPQTYGVPIYGPPHKEVVPVVKKVHVKHENLVHRHNHHKHVLHEHHLHKLHVHDHHLHRFHVHHHHKHLQHVHVPITHTHEKSEVKVTEEHKTIPTVGQSHQHVHTKTESVKHAPPMYVLNPHQPTWTPYWG